MKRITYALSASLCICGCHPLLLRFQNASNETMTHITIMVLDKNFAFDTLRPGQLTTPVTVPAAYYYCDAKITTTRDTLVYQPYDYIGEKLYRHGQLITELRIDTARNKKGRLVRYLHMDTARDRKARMRRQNR